MLFTPCSNRFRGRRTDSSASEDSTMSQVLPALSSDNSRRVVSGDSWNSYDPKNDHVEDTAPHRLTTCLPHTLMTTDLGLWDHAYRLRFSHFLPEDPSIAVFSKTQDTPVPDAWSHKRSWFPWRLDFRFRVRKGLVQVRSPCTVRIIVGSRLQYKISPKLIRYWSAEAGLLLVDWHDMYEDYFVRDSQQKNKKRAHNIAKKFRKLETKALVNETGPHLTRYDHWEIDAPTAADVAPAYRYECQGFEDGGALVKKTAARELRSRLKQVTDAVKTAVTRQIAKQKWRVYVKLRSLGITRKDEIRRTS